MQRSSRLHPKSRRASWYAFGGLYCPRNPRANPLWQCASRHAGELRAAGALRRAVEEQALERFLACGDPHYGLARIYCDACGHDYLLAYSCKRRYFCSSCHQRRVLLYGEWDEQNVLAPVPHRQCVFTVPRLLRPGFGRHRAWLGELCRIAARLLVEAYAEALPGARPGLILFVQVFGDLANFNPHVHVLATDGAFRADGTFVALPAIPQGLLVEGFRRAVLDFLVWQGAISEALRVKLLSLSFAAWRLALAAVILAPLVLVRHRDELAPLAPRDWLLAAAAGAFLAAHFAAWILSLEYTSVASSVALVTTNPIWIGIASWLFFRERLGGLMVLAIGLAIAGSATVFLADGADPAGGGSAPALCNTLAVVGSLTICGYLLIGRGLRRSTSLVPYVGVVYAAAVVCLVVLALAAGAPLGGFARESWLMLLALAIGPQLLGHSSFNWALKYLSATLIALAILGEPIGSTILAWWLLGEPVGAVKLGGMALLLAGIFLAARGTRPAPPDKPSV